MTTKRIGIVADDYKVNRFKKELSEAGYNDVTCAPLIDDLAGNTSIMVDVPENAYLQHLQQISKICQKIEMHFKHGN